MARHSSDREDLYAELHLASPRWEIRLPSAPTTTVAGIRSDGRLLLSLTPDLVYQFDAQNRLLRAYRDGVLFRTQGKTLARLRRSRTETTSELLRHDLTEQELETFLKSLTESLEELQQQLTDPGTHLLRSTETGSEPLKILATRLAGCLQTEEKLAPSYHTRRK